MTGSEVFVPRGVGHSAESIARVLFDYYKSRCADEEMVHLRSTKHLLGMLTPETCQLYVDSMQEEVEPIEDPAEQSLQELMVQESMLEYMGIKS